MNRSRWPQLLIATAALAVTNSGPALAQGPAVIGCGAVLMVNTTLTADLVGCTGDGLVIGADGITVNLKGHVVSGDAVEDPSDMGIRVSGHHDVTITNGTVEGFYRGVVFESSPSGVVTAMTVRQMTRRGIVFTDGSDGATVIGNVSADNHASGIAIVTSDGARVSNNRSLRNVGGAGVRLEGATHVIVTHNALNDDQFGVQMQDAQANRVVDNMIAGATEMGVDMEYSNNNFVEHNQIAGSGSGVIVGSSDSNTVTNNQILHSVGPDGIGVQIVGNDNLIAHNTLIDSVRYGIEVDDFGDPGHTPVAGNVLRGNVVNGAGEGIAIGPEAGGVVVNTLIEGNRVTGAVDDGIQVLGPSTGLATTTITGNVAVHNGNLGIAAVPGTIDGGGNHAAGNGNPLQCVSVSCS